MAQQQFNRSTPNDGLGDTLYDMAGKLNDNIADYLDRFGIQVVEVNIDNNTTSDNVTTKTVDAFNALSPNVEITKDAKIATSFYINGNAYFVSFDLRPGVGTYGLGQTAISTADLLAPVTRIFTPTQDPNDLAVATSIEQSINDGSQYDTSLIRVFRRTIDGEVKVYYYNGAQNFIGGANPDVTAGDFDDITNNGADDNNVVPEADNVLFDGFLRGFFFRQNDPTVDGGFRGISLLNELFLKAFGVNYVFDSVNSAYYSSLNSLYAGQANQTTDKLYFVDEDDTIYRYLGTTNGDSTDYEAQVLQSSGSSETKAKTGSTIDFTEDADWNFSSPLTSGSITIDPTGAKAGVVATVPTNSASELSVTGATVYSRLGSFESNKLMMNLFVWNADGTVSINRSPDQSESLSAPVFTMRNLSTTANVGTIEAVVGADGYEVVHNTVNNVDTATALAGYNGTDLVFNHNSLTEGQQYFYWVRATASGSDPSAYTLKGIVAGAVPTSLFVDNFTKVAPDANRISTIGLAPGGTNNTTDWNVTQSGSEVFLDEDAGVLRISTTGTTPTDAGAFIISAANYPFSTTQNLSLVTSIARFGSFVENFRIRLGNSNSSIIIENDKTITNNLQQVVRTVGNSDVTTSLGTATSGKIQIAYIYDTVNLKGTYEVLKTNDNIVWDVLSSGDMDLDNLMGILLQARFPDNTDSITDVDFIELFDNKVTYVD